MNVLWSASALDDLDRVRAYLAPFNPDAATGTIQALRAAAKRLSSYPQLGAELGLFRGHRLRRLVVGSYELWYEAQPAAVVIFRVWNTRQQRPI